MTEEELEEIIEKARIDRYTSFYLQEQSIAILPNSICNLSNLTDLNLYCNSLTNLPTNIGDLYNLSSLDVAGNCLVSLPESIGNLLDLRLLILSDNQITILSESIGNLINLDLPRKYCRYWDEPINLNPKWLLDEENAEIRRVLIQQVGYERICQELDAIDLDN